MESPSVQGKDADDLLPDVPATGRNIRECVHAAKNRQGWCDPRGVMRMVEEIRNPPPSQTTRTFVCRWT